MNENKSISTVENVFDILTDGLLMDVMLKDTQN